MNPLDRLVYWIQERESIRNKKEAGEPKPWTEDRILQSYRFCNVRRMDDKVSKWLFDNWYNRYYDHQNMLVACVLARHFNTIGALEEISEYLFCQYDKEAIRSTLRARQSNKKSVFSGAYMIHGKAGIDKVSMVLDDVVQPLLDDEVVLDHKSMKKSVNKLMNYWGFSSFLAGQVVADYRWAVSGSWTDRHTWAPMGPGSLRGINKLHGRWIGFKLSEEQFIQELGEVIAHCKEHIPSSITSRLEAMDYQNCLCELDKYTRVIEGMGKPKQRYQGT
jgi:hypothetical protein